MGIPAKKIRLNVKFGQWDAYEDLGLQLQPYQIPLPEPKTEYLSLAGGDGQIDLTEAAGDIRYNNRTFTLTLQAIDHTRSWTRTASTIANAIHGKRLNVVFSRDSSYYYDARCKVLSLSTQAAALGTVTIELNAAPYKMAAALTTVSLNISDGAETATLRNGRMPCYPTVTTNVPCTISWGSGQSQKLAIGKTQLTALRIPDGGISVTVTPNQTSAGIISMCAISYRQGSL